uniref:Mechanosensitive ion channel family protein n=1 Tax=uncultured Thiotrichaceae bacterium TaxID=298394 RepID=A0A6S6U491_9GAMM|nr:MAG: Mechanosensitive ion channel family protein [uncultured Thiotrichaceae bacterium]
MLNFLFNNRVTKQQFLLSVLCFVLYFLSFSPLSAADDVSVPDGSAAASVTDDQVRKVLLDILEGEPKSPGTGSITDNTSLSYDEATLSSWEPTETNKVAAKLRELQEKLPLLWGALKAALARSTSSDDGFTGWQVVITLLMHLALGLILEYVTTRSLLKRLYQYAQPQSRTTSLKIKFITTRLIIQMLGLLVFAGSTYACALFYIRQNPYFELLFLEFLQAFIFFRFSMLVLRSVLSPFFEPLRLLTLRDGTAKRMYYWGVCFFGFYAAEGFVLAYLSGAGMDQVLVAGLLIPMSIVLNIIILVGVWSMRKRITAMFVDEKCEAHQASFTGRFFAQFWPYFFTIWLLVIWVLWQYRYFQGRPDLAEGVGIAWVITLAFPIADRVFNALLQTVVKIPWLQSPAFERRSRRFINIVQSGFRIIMLTVSVFTVLHSWGFYDSDMIIPLGTGQKIIDLLIIGTIVYVCWELVHALIERKLPEEESALASLEGDGGGVGASRSETLLPLIRTTLTVVLAIFLVISVLHALGVAITPLLAGAGVVGIAIGFGAQKLVQDILSGVFFLIDDAFRKGEYIEIEELRGTVERISLRSMQLRHHLGAVQTIPYGEIKTVRNLSRDWITLKLELRLPYDTDIEKVRKIIKKVGQSMLKDEEMGPSFILPLKSQGVMRVEESALIVRMKFTTKPGEQWVIRREAYRRVRDALSEQGIHFAHREVRVVLPGDANGNDAMVEPVEKLEPSVGLEEKTPGVTLPQAAAAAVTSMLAAEAAKHELRNGDMGDSGDDR